MQLSFGSGAIWGERTDVIGSGIGPRQFGVLQDIQIDFDWSNKELYGQLQFPVAIARGQGKITGKAKFAQILGLLYFDIFFGVTPATGQAVVAAGGGDGSGDDALHRHPRQCGATMTISAISAELELLSGSTGFPPTTGLRQPPAQVALCV